MRSTVLVGGADAKLSPGCGFKPDMKSFFLFFSRNDDFERERALVHLKELLASVKMKLDSGFVSSSGREKVFKVRGQRDRRICVRKRFVHKALVEKNLQEETQATVKGAAASQWVWSNSSQSHALVDFWLPEANAYKTMLLMLLLVLQSGGGNLQTRVPNANLTCGVKSAEMADTPKVRPANLSGSVSIKDMAISGKLKLTDSSSKLMLFPITSVRFRTLFRPKKTDKTCFRKVPPS